MIHLRLKTSTTSPVIVSFSAIPRFAANRSLLMAIIFLLATLLSGFKGFSSDSTSYSIKKNIVFASFGGRENFGSINYERVFRSGKKLHWSYSIGVQPFQPSKKLSVPLSINAFTTGRLHHLELDLAATFYMDKYHPYDGGWKDDFNKQLYITPFICYRLQGTGRLMLKAGIGPQLRLDPPSDNILKPRAELLQPSVFAAVGFGF